MANFTVSRLIYAFTLIVLAGLGISQWLQWNTLSTLKVGGPVYNEIVNGKDLIADILPPPLYVVQSYALANESINQPDRFADNIARIKTLHGEFNARIDYWKGIQLLPEERSTLENDVITTGNRFWKIFDEQFVSLNLSDNGQIKSVLAALMDAYQTHDAAVGRLVKLSTDHLAATEKAQSANGAWLQNVGLAGAAGSLILFVAGIYVILRRAIAPLSKMTDFMTIMARGNLEADVPYLDRQDEIGTMAAAMAQFKAAGLEKQRLEAETAAATEQRQLERLLREQEAAQTAADMLVVVENLGAGLERLADCNIRQTIDQPFIAAFERIRNDFNDSLAAFQRTLEKVMSSTAEIQESSAEMQAAAENMARRTEQQAASVEQTAAALEQITATVANSSNRAVDTRALVSEAHTCAKSSADVVHDAITAMQRIEKASGEISHIISVIDEIAFQTNLLALNAGVEAARAGDAGRGFAVVAMEVRELAQRSATAAKEIKTLINNSAKEVNSGVKLVGQTGDALTRIEGFVAAIDVNIDAITTGVHEQSSGLKEISRAVNHLDQMTQQNAAMAQETSALSETLASEASALSGLVKRFKLNRRLQIREPGSDAAHRGPGMRNAKTIAA
jgi:methyl-accepting chemotaxis protein